MAALARRKNQELESGNMPELKAKVENIESYDVIFLGYPIWAMTAPTPVRSFIESHDLAGKTIVPFCTHDGYGPGRSVSVIKDLLPANTRVLDVFDVKGSQAGKAAPLISVWLKNLKW
jgi:flavodoxin